MSSATAMAAARDGKARAARQRRENMIREILASPSGRTCRCGIRPEMTLSELIELGSGCTAGRWVCPTLDTIRRRLGH